MPRRGQSQRARVAQIAGALSGQGGRNTQGARKSDLFTKLKEDQNNGQNQFRGDGTLYQYPSDLGNVDTSHFVLFHIYSGVSQKMLSTQRGMEVLDEMRDNSIDYRGINEYTDIVDPTTGEFIMSTEEAEGAYERLESEQDALAVRQQLLDLTQKDGGNFNPNNPSELGTEYFKFESLGQRGDNYIEDTSQFSINAFGENTGQSANHLTAKARSLLRGSRGPTRITKKETRVSKATYRSKESIALYMPHKINDLNVLEYEMSKMSGTKTLTDLMSLDGLGGAGKIFLNKAAKSLDSITSAVGLDGDSEAYMTATMKLVGNPRSELLFKQPQQRKFEFNFEFAPRTEEESEAIYDIVKTFKTHAYPATSASGVFYHFPSEFQIEYYKCVVNDETGKVETVRENDWLNRIARCALTEINVDYAPTGTYQTFENGAPTHINMSLTFGEMELLTQQHILEGH